MWILALGAGVFISAGSFGSKGGIPDQSDQEIESVIESVKPYDWVEDNRLIAHGMGSINGKRVTNSLQSLERNYEQGYRVFEVDLIATSDHKLVARHDWGRSLYPYLGQDIPDAKKGLPLTLEEFNGLLIHNKYTPLDFEQLVIKMSNYKDMYIVTDKMGGSNEEIRESFQTMIQVVEGIDPTVIDRIIPQIYSEEMFEEIPELEEFQHFIYTLYKTKDTNEEIMDFALQNNIKVIAMSGSRYSEDFVEDLASKEIYTYVHTINNTRRIIRYFDEGVHGVYSDYSVPNEMLGQTKNRIEKEGVTLGLGNCDGWNVYKSYEKYTIVKANLNLKDQLYVVERDGAVLKDTKVDNFNRADQSDIYSNKHLYITISHSDSGWDERSKPTSDEIKEYLSVKGYKIHYFDQ